MHLSPDHKLLIWSYMLSLPKSHRPVGCTDKRLEKVKDIIMKNEGFWDDVVCRHGLLNCSVDEQLKKEDPETYEHCVGNFWGMTMENMWIAGIIK